MLKDNNRILNIITKMEKYRENGVLFRNDNLDKSISFDVNEEDEKDKIIIDRLNIVVENMKEKGILHTLLNYKKYFYKDLGPISSIIYTDEKENVFELFVEDWEYDDKGIGLLRMDLGIEKDSRINIGYFRFGTNFTPVFNSKNMEFFIEQLKMIQDMLIKNVENSLKI